MQGHLNTAQNSLALKEKSSFAVHIRNAPVKQMVVNTHPSVPRALYLWFSELHTRGSFSKVRCQRGHPCPSSGPGNNALGSGQSFKSHPSEVDQFKQESGAQETVFRHGPHVCRVEYKSPRFNPQSALP